MTLVLFPRHRLYRCGTISPCDGCSYCLGGLAWCVTCGGGEASLPSECPQERMHRVTETAVYNGHLDFVGGRWVTISNEAKQEL